MLLQHGFTAAALLTVLFWALEREPGIFLLRQWSLNMHHFEVL